MRKVLVINAGSSSVKFAVFTDGVEVISGIAAEIGGDSRLKIGGVTTPMPLPDHTAAVAACLGLLAKTGHGVADFIAAGHRVVHGGTEFVAPCRITDPVIARIEVCVPLAPLHNPGNLAAIRALATLAPDLPQFASFDTAFHAGQPEVAARYAVSAEVVALGIRRYGFHGISYASLVQAVAAKGAPPRRLLALHLGNGASLCAILDGKSVATTMGYSPLEGLTMGTRTGGIDGNAVLRLAEVFGIAQAGHILNKQSGLLALGGASDMRELSQAHTPEAAFARDHFAYWAVRHAGSMIAAMGGIDALAFTGGIGENDVEIRRKIMAGLEFTGLIVNDAANTDRADKLHDPKSIVAAWIIPAAEEAQIAAEAMAVLQAEGKHDATKI
ncbi:acetate/propionate family kinase [Pseudorhodobacter sp.]|uniref:acetate/propionate family kinase n=1 Tax=Pseudorhodobacter sp. TaxID=1934400 RepID=UPI00264A462F|nr:acetate/propionate family kinase [Pseudorhodobacter sp.]MDN5787195.1 acetate/propionate family kinase [Pseudorhodobacter sp.]